MAGIFGKTLKEYLWPIRYYLLGAVLVVISQYTVGLPLEGKYPFILKLTQALWALIVGLSVLKLVKIYKHFNMGNVLVIGIIYSIIIHGLKIAIRFLFYDRAFWYLIERFFYGSFLVMVIVMPIGALFIYLKKKGVKW